MRTIQGCISKGHNFWLRLQLFTHHHWFKIYIAEGKEFNILHNAWLGKSPLLWISFRTQLNTWLDWWLSCHVGTSLGKSSWCLEKEYAKDKGCLMSTLWRKGVFESKTTHYIFYSNFLFGVFCFFERLCKERVGSDIEGLFMFGCCVGRSSQIVLWLEYTLCWSRVMLWFHHHNIEYTQTQLSASK